MVDSPHGITWALCGQSLCPSGAGSRGHLTGSGLGTQLTLGIVEKRMIIGKPGRLAGFCHVGTSELPLRTRSGSHLATIPGPRTLAPPALPKSRVLRSEQGFLDGSP